MLKRSLADLEAAESDLLFFVDLPWFNPAEGPSSSSSSSSSSLSCFLLVVASPYLQLPYHGTHPVRYQASIIAWYRRLWARQHKIRINIPKELGILLKQHNRVDHSSSLQTSLAPTLRTLKLRAMNGVISWRDVDGLM
ncbi:hypothetical protein Tco_0173547 [Tanacetum coccineum]